MYHDLNLIRVLVAIADCGRVGAAARLLGMTQPGVSNALRRLRGAYGDPLFIRSTHAMLATPRAAELVVAAREILDLHAKKMLGRDEFSAGSTTTEFRLAMSDIGEMVFLPRLHAHLRRFAPHATLRVLTLAPLDLPQAMEAGRVDLALGYFPDLRGSHFFQQKLFDHGFTSVVRADHPSVGRKLTRKQFLALGHVAVHAPGRSQEVFEQYLRARKIARRVVIDVPHFMSIPHVIAHSDLIVTVPLAVGTAFATMARVRLVDPPFDLPRFDVMQHWHGRVHKDARHRWLRTQIAQLFNTSTDEWRAARPVEGGRRG